MPDEPTKAPEDGERDAKGRYKPGHQGGPGRRRMDRTVVEMLEAATPRAAKALIEALDAQKAIVVFSGRDEPSTVEYVPDHEMRVKAATALFDRVYGKPAQAITDDDGGPVRLGLIFLPSETGEE